MIITWCCYLLFNAFLRFTCCADLNDLLKSPIAVWIDADPSIGIADVDDALAMLVAFSSKDVEVRGVSTVFGNADIDRCHDLAVWICSAFSPKAIPIYKGASSAAERGKRTNATDALADALNKEIIVIIALGPLTNIASTIMLHPQLARNITSIVAVAGRRRGQRFKPNENADHEFGDLNFDSDPHSFEYLLNCSQIPLTLLPWEVSSKVWITPSDIVTIGNTNLMCLNQHFAYSIGKSVYIHRYYEHSASDTCTSIALMTEMMARWSAVWTSSYNTSGFNPFDCVAVAYVIYPQLFNCEETSAAIHVVNAGVSSLIVNDGENSGEVLLQSNRSSHSISSRVTYCYSADFRSVRNLILQLLSTSFEFMAGGM